jgi:hypothetical protein
MHIVTNNPKIRDWYPAAEWVDGTPLEVLVECRRRVHEGSVLLAHPLMGDIHLLANPFRTVILGDTKGEVHLSSLHWVEESIAKLCIAGSKAERFESVEDYQILDLELVRAVVKSERTPGISLGRQEGTPNN